MPTRESAGLILYRYRGDSLEVLLGHPGGPFWAKKDAGAWSIPKGELDPGEEPLTAAIREVEEETGHRASGTFLPLQPVKQAGGKLVQAWAVEDDFEPAELQSNTFSMEWPPHSGRTAEFPELDRAEWFSLEEASRRILKGQLPLLVELSSLLAEAARES
jgi:predicted NUDIX family NTP pyrophosphohydrolase